MKLPYEVLLDVVLAGKQKIDARPLRQDVSETAAEVGLKAIVQLEERRLPEKQEPEGILKKASLVLRNVDKGPIPSNVRALIRRCLTSKNLAVPTNKGFQLGGVVLVARVCAINTVQEGRI